MFIRILLNTAQLFSKHFPPDLSLFVSFLSFFYKGKDTSTIPQQSIHPFVYVFPISFRFHKYFNNFD